jgi:hypothetical protein
MTRLFVIIQQDRPFKDLMIFLASQSAPFLTGIVNSSPKYCHLMRFFGSSSHAAEFTLPRNFGEGRELLSGSQGLVSRPRY